MGAHVYLLIKNKYIYLHVLLELRVNAAYVHLNIVNKYTFLLVESDQETLHLVAVKLVNAQQLCVCMCTCMHACYVDMCTCTYRK